MKITEWPENERPRERLLTRGPQTLSDSELLAVLIGCGKRGITAVDVARQLIKDFGSMSDFLRADKRECLEQFGIGPAHYASMQAALELARRRGARAGRAGAAGGGPAGGRAGV